MGAGGLAQVAEHLPCRCKPLSSKLHYHQKKKEIVNGNLANTTSDI
jgi:hypothetical protein